MHGRWRGELRLRVDPAGETRGWLYGAWARAVAALPGLAMETSVDCRPEGEVVHTTRLDVFRVPVLRSVERIGLQPDGRTASFRGRAWFPPLPWAFGPGEVHIDEDDRGATYRFRFLGVEVLQTTRVEDEDTLRVWQEVRWGRGEVLLRRFARELGGSVQ